VAVAAETRISHSVARVSAASAAAPTSLSHQVRDRKSGRPVECSSVVFDEQEDALTSSTGEREENVEFPDHTGEPQQVDETTVKGTDNTLGMQEADSKSMNPKILRSPCFYSRSERKISCCQRPIEASGEIYPSWSEEAPVAHGR